MGGMSYFMPCTFVAGIFGMNFVDGSGKPSINVLLWGQGYQVFWLVCLICLIASPIILIVALRYMMVRSIMEGMLCSWIFSMVLFLVVWWLSDSDMSERLFATIE